MVKQTIQIFARVKPTKKSPSVYSVDEDERAGSSLEFLVPRDLADGFVNNKKENYRFRFQKVFDQTAKQEEIFEHIAKPVADSVLAGYNGTIFAYGQTGSGKTFTITGGAERYSDRGIIPRTLSYLYQHFNQDSGKIYTTQISYLEIYNEVGYDLLDPRHEAPRLEDLPKVSIMEDNDQNIHLRNLSLQQSASEEEALNLLFLGDTNRIIAETPMNQASTRSHCIFTIHVCSREPGSATLRRSKLHLVDLAGSERVAKSGMEGQLLTEAKYINLSLHYLEQVIIALSEKNRSHIPYRNSMMTSVLRDSLGGNCMTTMIATLSVEKRNVDESIATCRFAQRVALIKNEAQLNEELDPALMINRLKKEVQSLRDELAILIGEQREDQLTEDDIHKLEEQVKAFLDDPDPEVTLQLGPNMRKIHHCFSLLKVMVQDMLPSGGGAGDCCSPSPSVVPDHDISPPSAELKKLKDMLRQRDNEISILVSMLKKEKKKVQEYMTQLAQLSNGHLQSKSSVQSSSAVLTEESGGKGESSSPYGLRRQGPALSMGRQEAFDIFRRDHEDNVTIDDNKALLKQRFAEAKALGEQVNGARNRINELKKQLEQRRMQRAAHAVIGVPVAQEEPDPVEERLCGQIEEEKKSYKNTFGRLKGLRTEIEHLQLLLDRAKVKLQRDFSEWWDQEEAQLQELRSEGGATGRSAGRSSQQPTAPRPTSAVRGLPARTKAASSAHSAQDFRSVMSSGPAVVGDGLEFRGSAPPLELRDLSLSTTSPSSSIPLTGDQQTDADILAFIRARHSLLSRTGQIQNESF
ncbi:kinesin-like protein KIF6 isoform X1 [Scleropages formosus]|uniref:Kinesin-like protein n=1 Tax=Scleropages formosus TaxID=113540 RepID=A0A8C9R071_SCLFO|nr:kinesin-like protein KIF6 isoform X1 [Scleropages formosus]